MVFQEHVICACMCVCMAGQSYKGFSEILNLAGTQGEETIKSHTGNPLQGQQGVLVGLHSLKTVSEVLCTQGPVGIYPGGKPLSTRTN